MVVDTMNEVANYFYILYEVKIIPILITGYGNDYDIFPDQLVVSKVGTTGEYKLHYVSTEADADTCTCTMEIIKDGSTYTMTNDSTANEFVYTFSDFLDIPENETTYYFTISYGGNPVGQYSATFVFRKTLTDFMRSNVVSGYNPSYGDSTSYIIYDIPVIEKDYYDSITKRDFELYVLQALLDSLTFSSYRMLTDFTNLKFPNTTGYLRNMQHNEVTKAAVIDIDITEKPTNPSVGDRYIVACCIDGWEDKINQIAECTDATSQTWIFTEPTSDDIVYVTNEGKKYIYCESGWIVPEFQIPLQLEIELFVKDTYTGSLIELADNVRAAIILAFTDKFGLNTNIYRSEIIETIMGVTGVAYCRLIKPVSNIFFNFDLQDLTTAELLLYTPELVYFRTEDISIKIVER